MHKWQEYLRMALLSMRVNLLRTFLTMIGVIVGVASVSSIGAVGQSGQAIIMKELETFGLKSVWVSRHLPDDPKAQVIGGVSINVEDAEGAKAACPHVTKVTPAFQRFGVILSRGAKSFRGKVFAANEEYADITNEEVARGRFLLPDDVQERRKVCVIGGEVVAHLFGEGEDPLGKEVDAGLGKFEVIGILKDKDRSFLQSVGSVGGQNINDRVILPYTVFMGKYQLTNVPVLHASATSVEEADQAAEELKAYLLSRHGGKYEYRSETMKHWIEVSQAVLGTAWWVALVAAFISLFVGGIGIMNIMTSSVIERIKEIGIRKSLGAKDRDILLQFLTEAVAISVTGGLVGLGIGIGVTLTIQAASSKPMVLSADFIMIGLLVSVGTGIVSGFYPAYRAARWDPVEALRYE